MARVSKNQRSGHKLKQEVVLCSTGHEMKNVYVGRSFGVGGFFVWSCECPGPWQLGELPKEPQRK